jgi:hypothetical protein
VSSDPDYSKCVNCYEVAEKTEWGEELIRDGETDDYWCGHCMEVKELNTCDRCHCIQGIIELYWDSDLEETHLDVYPKLKIAFEKSPRNKYKTMKWCALCSTCVADLQ